MRIVSIGLVAAALVSAAAQAAADCAEEVQGLTEELGALEAERVAERDAEEAPMPSAASPGGGTALTGDPLNPQPADPATTEVPTATPTDEEATGVMPGADASVELVAEDLAEVALLRDQALEAAEAGDDEACRQALDQARTLLEGDGE